MSDAHAVSTVHIVHFVAVFLALGVALATFQWTACAVVVVGAAPRLVAHALAAGRRRGHRGTRA